MKEYRITSTPGDWAWDNMRYGIRILADGPSQAATSYAEAYLAHDEDNDLWIQQEDGTWYHFLVLPKPVKFSAKWDRDA